MKKAQKTMKNDAKKTPKQALKSAAKSTPKSCTRPSQQVTIYLKEEDRELVLFSIDMALAQLRGAASGRAYEVSVGAVRQQLRDLYDRIEGARK